MNNVSGERGRTSGLRAALLILCAALGLCFAPQAFAEDSWGYDLGHDLMSPYCPGRTLATCPSPQAAELIQWIVLQEASGATRQEVLDQLVERFGDEILGAPKAEGLAIWAYVLPVLGFVGGGALAFLVLRRIVSKGTRPAGGEDASSGESPATALGIPTAPTGVSSPEDEEWARRVDEDLRRRG
jgi:cytochrome c-type biogenesis protein CcmH/NrfF